MTRATARFPVCGQKLGCHSLDMNNTWVVLLGILIWIGCIEFEKQTMTCRHFSGAGKPVIWQ
jgi:hypothetical protein